MSLTKKLNGNILYTICIGMIVLLAGCDWLSKQAQAQTPYLVIVNVLSKELFNDRSIGGSINVPFEDVEQYALKHWDKQMAHIVIFCANYKCTASSEAVQMLKDRGFEHVWAYEGGTAEWHQLNKTNPQKYKMSGNGSPDVSGYLDDYVRPEGMEAPTVPTLTAQELSELIEKFEKK